ncbi:hypothetical protein CWI36_0308p0020 [Hamiltosporidium magnivora]|uniref:Uncharacterized protein n=1 Tax=Hamiltosporidium magnivora TaxID=148818 RepID=A0A4Q9LGR5_9MICR|nr:hypothetical protein CWI36_0308p0020 [Hamiltosporidium magnivora]
MYGSELWGMGKVRIVSVGCGVTRSLAAAFGCREKFALLAAFRECDIQSLYEKAAMPRVRGFLKWQESRTIIRDLLNGKFTARKRTWVTQTRIWMKAYTGSLLSGLSNKSSGLLIKEAIVKRQGRADKSVISGLRRLFGLNSGYKWIYAELNNRVLASSIKMLRNLE